MGSCCFAKTDFGNSERSGSSAACTFALVTPQATAQSIDFPDSLADLRMARLHPLLQLPDLSFAFLVGFGVTFRVGFAGFQVVENDRFGGHEFGAAVGDLLGDFDGSLNCLMS